MFYDLLFLAESNVEEIGAVIAGVGVPSGIAIWLLQNNARKEKEEKEASQKREQALSAQLIQKSDFVEESLITIIKESQVIIERCTSLLDKVIKHYEDTTD